MRKEWLLPAALIGIVLVAFYYFEGLDALKDPAAPAPQTLAPPTVIPVPPPAPVSKADTDPAPRDGTIVKCTVNGKVTYSNTGCEAHQKQEKLALADSAGIVSPSRAQIDATLARSRRERQTYTTGGSQVMTIGQAETNSAECESLRRHITWLDAVARQPRDAWTQDRIADQRRHATSRQHALHC